MNSNPMYMEYVDDADPSGPAPARRGWRILGWVSIGLSAVMVVGSLAAYGLYYKTMSNINHEDVNANVGPNRPKKLNNALNILILGSDTRAGGNAKYGRSMKNEPPRSDTMILLHLSPGGGQAMGISFPRDLMIRIPSCKTKNGTTAATSRGQINSAFTLGGASCVIKTIEGISNIKIDHFMQVDFNGFKSITNAVGGVDVCLPKAVNDRQSRLKLGKGKHTIKGETALAYVRVRHGLGDGSDTDRIKRQQKFMGSLANKALSAGVLSNPSKLLSLLNATTKSLTTDEDLTPRVMMQIAQGMQGMTSGKLRFVTVPSGPDPLDPNRVALTQPTADTFFSSVRNDKTVASEPKASASKISPSQVRVRVYNASGSQGQAGRVITALESQGFHASLGGNMSSTATTKVLYGSGADQQAAFLAKLIPSKPRATARTSGGSPGVVDLVIGKDWTALKNVKAGIPKQQGEIRATDDICKGS
ncbi:LCP family protein [Spirillospora sp. NPDC048911]|uniref:LCP family protein n=1 Tax=Spirillospora sp. NPDC048911 TaxID=3364527 RepID=UPI00371CA718